MRTEIGRLEINWDGPDEVKTRSARVLTKLYVQHRWSSMVEVMLEVKLVRVI